MRAWLAGALATVCFSAGAAPSADAVLLVNSTSASYGDVQRFVRPYLDHLGVPYVIQDIATTPVGASIGDHALIIVGHRGLDPGHVFLDATEQSNLTAAVLAGSGLVNFDNDLADAALNPRYQFVQNLFAFSYVVKSTASSVQFPSTAPGHYVTVRHAANETLTTGTMTSAGITLPTGGSSLVEMSGSGQPLVASVFAGQGRAVQWGSYDWMSHAVFGPLHGLDDVLWRSLVWAARKPFVLRGMPNFVTMRVDDVQGGLWWARTANQYGLKPWLGLFYGIMSDANAAELASIVNAGGATASIHSISDGSAFYFNHGVGNWPDSTMAANFASGTSWHTAHGIPISKVVIPHYYEMGTNAFTGLASWGVEYVGTVLTPGSQYMSSSPWIVGGPYQLYESESVTGSSSLMYADALPIPGHPELTGQFFNCLTEIRDESGYEWAPFNDVTVSVDHAMAQLRRSLDSMTLATLFTHEQNIQSVTQASWQAEMSSITSQLAPYAPIYVTMDEACRYLRAKHRSTISSVSYDAAAQRLTTVISGSADVTTQFFVFSDPGTGIVQSTYAIPAFSGSTQVTFNVAPTSPGPSLTSIGVFPANATVSVGATQQYAALGTYSDGTTRDVTGQVAWASASPAVASVNTSGLASGLAAGTTSLSAAAGSIVGTGTLTVQAAAQTFHTLFSAAQAPRRVDAGADSPVELGVRFRSDVSGSATGIRFYKSANNTGTHVGNLWTSTGTLLASATFSGESASGWQEVSFSVPVAIQANTVYVASYHTNVGHFAADRSFFTLEVDSPPLHAPADGASGPNGCYGYGANSTFPAGGFQATNYWVDVVVSTASAPGPALSSISIAPANPTIAAGATLQLAATGTYSDGSTRDLTGQASWSSSNGAVATVSAVGLASGLAAGSAAIAASVGAVQGTALLTVQLPATLSSIAISPGNPTIPMASTQQFAATGTFSDGSTRDVTSQVTWASSNGAVATINAAGLASVVSAGTTSISAAQGSAQASTVLTVQATAATATTIWQSTAAPRRSDAGSDGPVELGVKFRSDVNGYVTGVRFYKSFANTGTHVGSLWTISGTRLASATFSAESAAGWQEVTFTTPVSISANTVYIASYHTDVGHYSADSGYFWTVGVDSPPLHAPADGVFGPDGCYGYGPAGTFPQNGFNGTNYWVDVVFVSTPGPAPTLSSIAVTPASAAVSTGATQQFVATGSYSDGSVRDLTSLVTWASSSPSVATVGASGLATGVSAGAATISATQGSFSSSAALTVLAQPQGSVSIFQSTLTPGNADAGADSAVELGVRFRSDVNGRVTGIRFYKSAANTGSHVGSLWTSTGTLLAAATFASESASGWQQVTFASPVTVTANTVYVASYHTEVGHYSADRSFFATGLDEPPLHALADGVSGPDGCYAYGPASTFPQNGFQATNYWVDVAFVAGP